MFFMFHNLVIIIFIFDSVFGAKELFFQVPSEPFKISSYKDVMRNGYRFSSNKPLFHRLLRNKNLKSNVFDKMLSDEMFSIKQHFFDQDLAHTTSGKNIFSQNTPPTPTLEVKQKWPVMGLITKEIEKMDQYHLSNEKSGYNSNDDLDDEHKNLESNMNDNLDQIESEKMGSISNDNLDTVVDEKLVSNINDNLDKIESLKLSSKFNDDLDLDTFDCEKLGSCKNDTLKQSGDGKISSTDELNSKTEGLFNMVRCKEVNEPLKKNFNVRSLGPSRDLIHHAPVRASSACGCRGQSQHHLRTPDQDAPDFTQMSHNPQDCSRTTVLYSILPFYYPYSMNKPFFINDEDPPPQQIYYQPPVINNVKIPKKTKKRKTTKHPEYLYYDDNNSKEDSSETDDEKNKNILIDIGYDIAPDKKPKPNNVFLSELDQIYDANVKRNCYCSSGNLLRSVSIYIYSIFFNVFSYLIVVRFQ